MSVIGGRWRSDRGPQPGREEREAIRLASAKSVTFEQCAKALFPVRAVDTAIVLKAGKAGEGIPRARPHQGRAKRGHRQGENSAQRRATSINCFFQQLVPDIGV